MNNIQRVLPLLAAALAGPLLSCAPPKIVMTHIQKVDFSDNIGGASKAVWKQSHSGILRVEVENAVGDCTLTNFDVEPIADTDESRRAIFGLQDPDSIANGRAVVHILTSDPVISVSARYEHVVLVSSGTLSEPAQPRHSAGSGKIQVGPNKVYNGYHFDHYDFSSQDFGPGGASATVANAPSEYSQNSSLTIDWYYNNDSSITFNWAIYAKGPCDKKP